MPEIAEHLATHAAQFKHLQKLESEKVLRKSGNLSFAFLRGVDVMPWGTDGLLRTDLLTCVGWLDRACRVSAACYKIGNAARNDGKR